MPSNNSFYLGLTKNPDDDGANVFLYTGKFPRRLIVIR